jgi:hypothetical protein
VTFVRTLGIRDDISVVGPVRDREWYSLPRPEFSEDWPPNLNPECASEAWPPSLNPENAGDAWPPSLR